MVAVVIPALTNEFRTVRDIGWYSSAAYVLSLSLLHPAPLCRVAECLCDFPP